MKTLRTHEQARAWLSHQGISIAQWSREHGFSHALVREILAGRKKCTFGASHNIAVALGMKHGTPTSRPGRGTPVRRPKATAGHPGAAA